MSKINCKKFILLILILPLFLTGCYDRYELDNLAYVIAIGADQGENGNINITYQVVIPIKITGENSSSGKETYTTYTVSAPSLSAGNTIVNAQLSKELNLSQLKLILYSEELAISDLKGHINSLMSQIDIRPKTPIAICKGKAEDMLKNSAPKLEANPARFYELLLSSYNYTNITVGSELINFYAATQSLDREPFALYLETLSSEEITKEGENKNASDAAKPIATRSEDASTKHFEESLKEMNENEQTMQNQENTSSQESQQQSSSPSNAQSSQAESEKNDGKSASVEQQNSEKTSGSQEEAKKIVPTGIALFKGSKMVGILDSDLIISHLILTNDFNKSGYYVTDFKDDTKVISVMLEQAKPTKIKVEGNDTTPIIKCDVFLEAHLVSSGSDINFFETENKKKLTQELENAIKETILQYFDVTTKEFETDVAGIGRFAKANFLTWPEFVDSHWLDQYKNASYDVNVSVRLNVSQIVSHFIPSSRSLENE